MKKSQADIIGLVVIVRSPSIRIVFQISNA